MARAGSFRGGGTVTSFELKVAALNAGQWFNPPDEIISVVEAASRGGESLMRFVTWWGDAANPVPAGFTHFEFDWSKIPDDDGRKFFDIVAIEYLEGTRTSR